jgi:hypothetical protein
MLFFCSIDLYSKGFYYLPLSHEGKFGLGHYSWLLMNRKRNKIITLSKF